MNTKTFADLKADLLDWLLPAGGNPDENQIETFIILAEEMQVNGDPTFGVEGIRIRQMLDRVITVGDGTKFLGYPEDYLDMRVIRFANAQNSRGKLTQVQVESLIPRSNNEPTQYALERSIEFNAAVGDTQEIEMIYYRPLISLSDAEPQNFLLNNAYGTYLYGALVHAAPYLHDDERLNTWVGGYKQAASSIQAADDRGRVNQGQARVSMHGISTP